MRFKILELPKNIKIKKQSTLSNFLSILDKAVYSTLTKIDNFPDCYGVYLSQRELNLDKVDIEEVYSELEQAWETQTHDFLSDIILAKIGDHRYVTLATKENRADISVTLFLEDTGDVWILLFDDTAYRNFAVWVLNKNMDWVEDCEFVKAGEPTYDFNKLEKIVFDDRKGFQIIDQNFFYFLHKNGLSFFIKQDIDSHFKYIETEIVEDLDTGEPIYSYEYKKNDIRLSLIMTEDNQEILSIRAEIVEVSEHD